jgi:hypothetical protein
MGSPLHCYTACRCGCLAKRQIFPRQRGGRNTQEPRGEIAPSKIRCGDAVCVTSYQSRRQPGQSGLEKPYGVLGFGTVIKYHLRHGDDEKHQIGIGNERAFDGHVAWSFRRSPLSSSWRRVVYSSIGSAPRDRLVGVALLVSSRPVHEHGGMLVIVRSYAVVYQVQLTKS